LFARAKILLVEGTALQTGKTALQTRKTGITNWEDRETALPTGNGFFYLVFAPLYPSFFTYSLLTINILTPKFHFMGTTPLPMFSPATTSVNFVGDNTKAEY
jgi:hypothetical protein